MTVSRRALSWVGADVHLVGGQLIGRGSVSATGSLVSLGSSLGLTPLVLAGVPGGPAPIPEPTAALLFAAGTGLVAAWLRRPRA